MRTAQDDSFELIDISAQICGGRCQPAAGARDMEDASYAILSYT